MATPSGILVWRIPYREEADGLQSMGLRESDMSEHSTQIDLGFVA